jgi:mannitol-1-/sugar-/sorbitol-6-phosphatase
MTNHRRLFPDHHIDAFLFDMDGTILTSIVAAERVWARWARKHGLDVEAFLPTLHGVRTIETVKRQNLPVDPEAEARWITEQEMVDTDGITEIPGAARFLASLPDHGWAIVTSATRDLALRRIEIAGLPMPPVLVTSEDVVRGKPEPDCFLLGAERLGVAIEDCVIFEDAPAGIQAAEASGAQVVVITHTHREPMSTPHLTVPGYDALEAREGPNETLELFQA